MSERELDYIVASTQAYYLKAVGNCRRALMSGVTSAKYDAM